MTYTIRPISDRTAFTGRHHGSPFSASWTATERLLIAEVAHLQGREFIIEADFTEADIRIDGRIRANARPATPAVRVAFDSKYGSLTYATDRFGYWQDNVRAIALGLEALRKVDRYGITKRGEQYAGWKQLPPGRGDAASHMTADEAWSIIGSFGEVPIVESRARGDGARLFRLARKFAHPDRHDGNRELWDQVELAGRVLGLAS